MNNFKGIFSSDAFREVVYDVMDALVVQQLQETYITCLDWGDLETAEGILVSLRYFMVYNDFKQFLDEVQDAGYKRGE